SPSSREYPHRGRSSVARPSNQEKSQPSSGTDPPSARSCSNVGAAVMPEPGEQVVLGDGGPGGVAGPDEALPAEGTLGDVRRDLAEPRVLYLADVREQGVPLAAEHRPDVDRGGGGRPG